MKVQLFQLLYIITFSGLTHSKCLNLDDLSINNSDKYFLSSDDFKEVSLESITSLCNQIEIKNQGKLKCSSNYNQEFTNLNLLVLESSFDLETSLHLNHLQNQFQVLTSSIPSLCIESDDQVQLNYQLPEMNLALFEEIQEKPWGLDRINQRQLPLDDDYLNCQTGEDVHVFVLDTGINTQHSEFEGRIGEGSDQLCGCNTFEDCNGHGTHVSSTILGTKYGIASKAIVHPVRIFDCSGWSLWSIILRGLNFVVDWNKNKNPDRKRIVINMSLGGSRNEAFNQALTKIIQEEDIVVVVSSGNNFRDALSESPASVTDAITVGSTNIADEMSFFSNYGPALDLFAPGEFILGAWIGNSESTKKISGTSMATPHVSGIATVLLSQNPSLSYQEVSNIITSSATPDLITRMKGVLTPNRLAYLPNQCSHRTTQRPSTISSLETTTSNHATTTELLTSKPTGRSRTFLYDLNRDYVYYSLILHDATPNKIHARSVIANSHPVRMQDTPRLKYLQMLSRGYLLIQSLQLGGTNVPKTWTISTWIRAYPHIGRISIFSYGPYLFRITGTSQGTIQFRTGRSLGGKTQDLYGITDVRDNRWHHILINYDAESITGKYLKEIYVDGNLDKRIVHDYQYDTERPLYYGTIGKSQNRVDDYDPSRDQTFGFTMMSLWIDELIFNSNEVKSLYQLELPNFK